MLQILFRHIGAVDWDEINIVRYGTLKDTFRKTPTDILFDDEIGNRESWQGVAYDVDNILGVLTAML